MNANTTSAGRSIGTLSSTVNTSGQTPSPIVVRTAAAARSANSSPYQLQGGQPRAARPPPSPSPRRRCQTRRANRHAVDFVADGLAPLARDALGVPTDASAAIVG